AGFALGLFWTALLASLVGELSMAAAYRINRRHFRSVNADMVEHHNLSLKALRAKDKSSWKACNDLANDAFGKNFFSGAALFAASLWPAAVALGWLDWRFAGVAFDLPLAGEVGPAFLFLPAYILTRVGLALARPRIPGLRRLVFRPSRDGQRLLTFTEVFGSEGRPARRET
ncbi:MAG: hypothetical protein ACOCVM_09755, partial [Desulfovibrionaceae bacterium]